MAPLNYYECVCLSRLLQPGKDEDDIIQEKKLQKLERKKYKKDQEVLMDELLPKATGREAMLEKKALRREQARAREDSPENFKEKDVMGGGDDFQQRCVIYYICLLWTSKIDFSLLLLSVVFVWLNLYNFSI